MEWAGKYIIPKKYVIPAPRFHEGKLQQEYISNEVNTEINVISIKYKKYCFDKRIEYRV